MSNIKRRMKKVKDSIDFSFYEIEDNTFGELRNKLDELINKYGEDAKFDLDIDWDGHIELSYVVYERLETEKEAQKRVERRRKAAETKKRKREEKEEKEKKELQRLMKKYGTESIDNV